jgi:hypothetical protein
MYTCVDEQCTRDREQRFLINVNLTELIDIVEALRAECNEYRRQWKGYEHRLNVHWLKQQEALADRIEEMVKRKHE